MTELVGATDYKKKKNPTRLSKPFRKESPRPGYELLLSTYQYQRVIKRVRKVVAKKCYRQIASTMLYLIMQVRLLEQLLKR